MDVAQQPRWFWVRRLDRFFLRFFALPMTFCIPLAVVTCLRQGDRSGAIGFCVFALFGFRYLRSLALGVAVLPDAIVVTPVLSFGGQRLSIETLDRAVYHRQWLAQTITIYRRNRLLPPIVLISGFAQGYRVDDWEELEHSLRQLLEPLGKWKEAPWWQPWFPL